MLKTSEILAEANGIIRLALLITEPLGRLLSSNGKVKATLARIPLLRQIELNEFSTYLGSKIDKSAEL